MGLRKHRQSLGPVTPSPTHPSVHGRRLHALITSVIPGIERLGVLVYFLMTGFYQQFHSIPMSVASGIF